MNERIKKLALEAGGRNGQDYNYLLDQLIYNVTGHII
jgi:hypothetical protein